MLAHTTRAKAMRFKALPYSSNSHPAFLLGLLFVLLGTLNAKAQCNLVNPMEGLDTAIRRQLCAKVDALSGPQVVALIQSGEISTGACKLLTFQPGEAACQYYFVTTNTLTSLGQDARKFGLNGIPISTTANVRHTGCISGSRYIDDVSPTLDVTFVNSVQNATAPGGSPEEIIKRILINQLTSGSQTCRITWAKNDTQNNLSPDNILKVNSATGINGAESYDLSSLAIDEAGSLYVSFGYLKPSYCPVSEFAASIVPWKQNLARKARLLRNLSPTPPTTISSVNLDTRACSGGSSSGSYVNTLNGISFAQGAWVLKLLRASNQQVSDTVTNLGRVNALRMEQTGWLDTYAGAGSNAGETFFRLSNAGVSPTKLFSLCFNQAPTDSFCTQDMRGVAPNLVTDSSKFRTPPPSVLSNALQ